MLTRRIDEIIHLLIYTEIYFSSSVLDTCNENEVCKIAEALRNAGLSFTFHAPFMDLASDGVDT